jgi:hypothetical protein
VINVDVTGLHNSERSEITTGDQFASGVVSMRRKVVNTAAWHGNLVIIADKGQFKKMSSFWA